MASGSIRIVTGIGASALRAGLDGDPLTPLPSVAIEAEPTLAGPAGRAWAVPLEDWRKFSGRKPDGDASIGAWIIEAPRAHPLWHSYLLTLVHLRPVADLPPPLIYLPGATHEFVLHALDPICDRNLMLTTGRAPRGMLTPPNFAAQIIERSDDQARDRLQASVGLICEGVLNPDTDARATWVALYGDNMMRKS